MTPFDVVKQRLQVRLRMQALQMLHCIEFVAAALRQAPCCNLHVMQRDPQNVQGAGGEEPVQGRLGLRIQNTEGGGHRRVLQVLPNNGASQ